MRNSIRIVILFAMIPVSLLSGGGSAFAQQTREADMQALSQAFKYEDHSHQHSEYTREARNELDLLMNGSFFLYKSFLSSQDNPSCVFHPSCSVYALEVMKRKGLLVGLLYTFDRLSRCHFAVKPGQYPVDIEHMRFYDPIP